MPQETGLQRAISVYRDRKTHDSSGLAVNMMAAANAEQSPAASLHQAGEVAAGQYLHTEISRMRLLSSGFGSATSTERQPSTASCRLWRSSSIVSPWVAHPGIAGTSAQKPPSSAS